MARDTADDRTVQDSGCGLPADRPDKFDGTVVVEWLNVTGGIDCGRLWLNAHIQMIRQGMAFVGVDAQAGGLYGQAARSQPRTAQAASSRRTRHAMARCTTRGDSFSYSIYQQTGQALHADGLSSWAAGCRSTWSLG